LTDWLFLNVMERKKKKIMRKRRNQEKKIKKKMVNKIKKNLQKKKIKMKKKLLRQINYVSIRATEKNYRLFLNKLKTRNENYLKLIND